MIVISLDVTATNMLKFLLAAVVFLLFFKDSQASYCLQWKYNRVSKAYDSYYTTCAHGCCGGTAFYASCCSVTSTSTPSIAYDSTWGIGIIIGSVVGGIIGLLFFILIIVCIVKACTKSESNARALYTTQYPQHNPNVYVTNTVAQPYMYPQPYPHQYPPPQAGAVSSPYLQGSPLPGPPNDKPGKIR